MSEQHTEKYLSRYAEPEIHSLSKLLGTLREYPYHAAVIIPAYDEQNDYIVRWAQHPSAPQNLLITVVNAPQAELEKPARNLALWQYLKHHFSLEAQADNLYFFTRGSTKILAVDRFTRQGIPQKQGVGLARKIACDLSVYLHTQKIQSSPWIFSSDADAHLPNNYFSSILNKSLQVVGTSALVFNFEHIQETATKEVFLATQTYERAIKYYYEQLTYAGSPYAFYTLGSTLAIHIIAYVQVRGFPKRAGGEDFYLLNKLAKTGKVLHCPEISIQLEARVSHRVPFGTGPAVTKIIEQQRNSTAYSYYSPKIFIELKQWLHLNSQLWYFIDKPKDIPWPSEYCKNTLTRLHFFEFLKHASKQCKTMAVFEKTFHDWFDGFITLKFIRDMQSHYYPPQPLEHCLNHACQQKHERNDN